MNCPDLGLRHLLATLALALAPLTPAAAGSFDHVYDTIQADTVYDSYLTVAYGETVTLETVNLAPGTDTVLHLWDTLDDQQAAYNDDGGSGLASRFVFHNTKSTRTFRVIVRAYGGWSKGTADLEKNGSLHAAGLAVGGERTTVPCGAAYTYETALSPSGSPDTLLYGFNTQNHMVARDDDNGIGAASRITGTTQMCRVIVAHYPWSSAGPTRLYVNDTWQDSDGDGLGELLEAELGTCDDASDPGCSDVFNRRDTDRDGLEDAAELFGIEGAGPTMLLPRWGADPMHKDIFVELDHTDQFTSNPFQGSDFVDAQAYFDVGPASSLQNPDGLDGVSLHVDVGFNPTDPALDTLYGDWGGADSIPDGIAYGTAANTYRDSIRDAVFHYGLFDVGSGGGQGWAPGDRFGWSGSTTNRRVTSFVHELGHNLNLQHHGHSDWGALNCKPNYRSVMNYAFSGFGFSQGSASATINPTWLREDQGLGTGANPTYLQSSPFNFPVDGDEVDWNRDGQWTASGSANWFPYGYARSGATWGTWASCSALTQNRQALDSVDVAGTTPALVNLNDRLYAFWVEEDGDVKYRSGQHSGLDWNGSCPGGDALGDTCMTWGSTTTVPLSQDAVGLDAIAWQGDIVLAYRTAAGQIRRRTASAVSSAGTLSGWTTDSFVTMAEYEPELTLLHANSSLYGASEVLGLMYQRQGNDEYRLYTATSSTGGLSYRGALKTPAGTIITGDMAPEAVVLPGSVGTTCAALPDLGRLVHLHCLNPTTGRWTDLTTSAFAGRPLPKTTGKASLAYHQHRGWAGHPLTTDLAGQVWLAVVTDTGFPDVLVSNTLTDSTPADPNLHFDHIGKVGNVWTKVRPGSGLALYEDGELGALKGLMVQTNDDDQLDFLPLADGTIDITLEDGDDFAVMERGICLGMGGTTICGDASTSASGL